MSDKNALRIEYYDETGDGIYREFRMAKISFYTLVDV